MDVEAVARGVNGNTGSVATGPNARTLKAARKLVKEGDYLAARKMVLQLVSDNSHKSSAYELLSKIAAKEDNPAEALDHARSAYEVASRGPSAVAMYLKRLGEVENYRAALDFYRRLPKPIKHHEGVKFELYLIYRFGLRWRARASLLNPELWRRDRNLTDRLVALLIRLGGRRILIHVEKDEEKRLMDWPPNYRFYDGIRFDTPNQALAVKAQLDWALLSYQRLVTWSGFARFVLLAIFGVSAVIASTGVFVILGLGIQAAVQIPVGLAITAVAFGISGLFWNVAINARGTYRAAVSATTPLVISVVTVGSVLAATSLSDHKWVALVATGLLTGGLLFEIAVVGDLVRDVCAGYLFRWHRRGHARMMALDYLAGVAEDAQDARARVSVSTRRAMVYQLEYAADTIERDVLAQISARDPGSSTWFANRLKGVAEAVRQMKRQVLSPSGDSWQHLSRIARQQVAAIATDNWGGALYREPPERAPRRKRDRILAIGQLVAVAGLPGLAAFVADVSLDLGSDARRWLIIVALSWAVLSILYVLDPALREKAEIARGVWSTLRDVADKEAQPRAEHPSGGPGASPQARGPSGR
jgi:hypothetical protein